MCCKLHVNKRLLPQQTSGRMPARPAPPQTARQNAEPIGARRNCGLRYFRAKERLFANMPSSELFQFKKTTFFDFKGFFENIYGTENKCMRKIATLLAHKRLECITNSDTLARRATHYLEYCSLLDVMVEKFPSLSKVRKLLFLFL